MTTFRFRRSPRLAHAVSLVLATLLAAALALAPRPAAGAAAGLRLSLSALEWDQYPTVTAVLSVTNEHGYPITGLAPSDLAVRENGRPVEQVHLEPMVNAAVPLAAVLVIDISGSMDAAAMQAAKAAAASFIDALGEQDEVALLAFSTGVHKVVDFTADKGAVKGALNALQPGGNTALYDALFTGVATALESGIARRVVVLETDGRNTQAGASLEDGLRLARANGVPVHTIGLGRDVDQRLLTQVAQATGGAAALSPHPAALREAYQTVLDNLRNQYRLTYVSPTGQSGEHRLQVSVRQGLQVATAQASFTVVLPSAAEPVSEASAAPEPWAAAVTYGEPEQSVVEHVAGAVGEAAASLWSGVAGAAGNAWDAATGSLRAIGEGATGAVRSAWEGATGALHAAVSGAIAAVAGAVQGVVEGVGAAVQGTVQGVTGAVGSAWTTVTDGVAAAVEGTVAWLGLHARLLQAWSLIAAGSALGARQLWRIAVKLRERRRAVTCEACGEVYPAYQETCPACAVALTEDDGQERSLGQMLVENGVLTHAAVDWALENSRARGRGFEDVLLEGGWVTPKQLEQARFYLQNADAIRSRRARVAPAGPRRRLFDLRVFAPQLALLLIALLLFGGLGVPQLLRS